MAINPIGMRFACNTLRAFHPEFMELRDPLAFRGEIYVSNGPHVASPGTEEKFAQTRHRMAQHQSVRAAERRYNVPGILEELAQPAVCALGSSPSPISFFVTPELLREICRHNAARQPDRYHIST